MSAGETRKRVIIATSNRGKIAEMREALSLPGWEFLDARELGFEPLEVEETGTTFEENAVQKARAYAERYRLPALADDSGLEVDALGGAPGVRSARYAGEGATDEANNGKLLLALSHVPEGERSARFRCVLALVWPQGRTITVSGTCEGSIGFVPRGTNGFGYDPLFLPDATPGRTMAELTLEQKHAISHRGAALCALRRILEGATDDRV